MSFNAAAVRRAIRDVLEGASGTVRTVASGTMVSGVFEGQQDAAQKAKTLLAEHRFDVRLASLRNHEASPVGAIGSYRLARVEIFVEVLTATRTVVQIDARDTLLAAIASDMDEAIQALAFPANVATTAALAATGIVSGLLTGPGGEGVPEWTEVAQDWERQEIRSRISASATLRIEQDVPLAESDPLPTVTFNPLATSVLFLGDDGSVNNTYLRTAIANDGYTVINATPFYSWSGSGLADCRVVVVFNADNYTNGFTAAGHSALESWLLSGGTVVRTEWTVWAIGSESLVAQGIDTHLPVDSVGGDYRYDVTWSVTDALHPLTAGLPASFAVAGGGSADVVLAASATAVATAGAAGPAVSFKSFGSGRVIHINSDFNDDAETTPNASVVRVLRNAVAWGAP